MSRQRTATLLVKDCLMNARTRHRPGLILIHLLRTTRVKHRIATQVVVRPGDKAGMQWRRATIEAEVT